MRGAAIRPVAAPTPTAPAPATKRRRVIPNFDLDIRLPPCVAHLCWPAPRHPQHVLQGLPAGGSFVYERSGYSAPAAGRVNDPAAPRDALYCWSANSLAGGNSSQVCVRLFPAGLLT